MIITDKENEMRKVVRPEIFEIQSRFFSALETKNISLQSFCTRYNLNRVKYSNIRTEMRHPEKIKPKNYKIIDLDALAYLCHDYGVSFDWLLLGKGEMLSK